MTAYDNYNPKITYSIDESDDKVISTSTPSGKTRQSSQQESRKAENKNQQAAPTSHSQVKVSKWLTAQFYRDLAANPTLKLILGLAFGFFGLYLLISFISYLSACIADQSAITDAAIGTVKNITNKGGEAGARISELLINRTFGLGAAVIILWLFAMCLKLFGTGPRFKTVNFTIKCFVALISVSLIVGLLTITIDTPVNWGGMHGKYVNEFIIDFFGYIGAIILCIFSISVFVVLCLRDVINWIIKLRKKQAANRRKLAAERAAEEERIRRIRQLEEEERQEAITSGEQVADTANEEEDSRSVKFEGIDDVSDISDEGLSSYSLEDEDEERSPITHAEGVVSDLSDSDMPTDDTIDNNSDNKSENDKDESEENSLDGPMVVNQGIITEGSGKAPTPQTDMPRRSPYKFPPYNLLLERDQSVEIDPQEQLDNKERIRKTLNDFGIPITSIEATVGPTVTLYEIVPERGVKISKISSLVDDIALRIAAIGVRIIAPIPGKGTVGIEVANKDPQTVSMRTIIKSQAFQQSRYKLPIALGATISNKVFISDLSKMPHLLVAGATGQGKSVGLNAIITSLLYSRRPDELKFVLIDPKMVEFSLYAKIENSYLAKLPDEEDAIITDITRVAPTLSSLCVEMDDRYRLLRKAAARNIEEYNKKFNDHALNPENGHKFLPYIVIIVDEFSDLIMQSGKEVEMPVARLAQKARAVGMHVIIATQRPSTDVITGIIKGNFPARIAFKVSSGVDSKTILDTTGAQQLIGRGDMLVSNNSEMTRVQCAFIDTPEVEAICEYISNQPYQQGPYILPEPVVAGEEGGGKDGGGSLNDRDPLFDEVARRIVSSNTASTSSLQRHYSIGYNRAGRIMEQLERAGIVGPAHGGKPRSVLVDSAMLEEILNSY